jgi:hypothetical protein
MKLTQQELAGIREREREHHKSLAAVREALGCLDVHSVLEGVERLAGKLAEARKDSDLLRDLIDADDRGGDLLAERVWDEPYGKSGNVQAEVKAMLRSAIDAARSKP